MKDFDNRDKKNLRKQKLDSQKNRSDEFLDERRFARKNVKNLKNKMKELEADERWEDWNNEIY